MCRLKGDSRVLIIRYTILDHIGRNSDIGKATEPGPGRMSIHVRENRLCYVILVDVILHLPPITIVHN